MSSNLTPRLLLGIVAATPALTLAQTHDWMTDDKGVLELKVAQVENNHLCGAVLRLDRNKRSLLHEGIPGEIGCKAKIEVSFDDVKSVDTGDEAGLTLELKKGKPRKALLIPVPHAPWLLQQAQVKGGQGQGMEASGLKGPDGDGMKMSGSGSGAVTLKKVELPKPVVDDTKKAVEAIREALGLK